VKSEKFHVNCTIIHDFAESYNSPNRRNVKFFTCSYYCSALLLCRAIITNQVDREGSSYYYLPLTPRVSLPITAISGPILYLDNIGTFLLILLIFSARFFHFVQKRVNRISLNLIIFKYFSVI